MPASRLPVRARPPRGPRSSGLPAVLLLPALPPFLLLPLVALLSRAPWSTLPEQLSSPEVGQALRLSLCVPVLATLLCLVLGVPLAWLLARAEFPGRRLVRALVTVPLVLPPVVGGVALLLLLGRRGLLGQSLDVCSGSRCPSRPRPSSSPRRSSRCRSSSSPSRARCAAPTAATRTSPPPSAPAAGTVFRAVTLPLIAPGARRRRGPVRARARSASSAPPSPSPATSPAQTQTMPLAVYLALEPIPTRPSRCRWCCSLVSRRWSSPCCATAGSERHGGWASTRDLAGGATGASRSTSPLRRSTRARSSRCSARTARARRPCCRARRPAAARRRARPAATARPRRLPTDLPTRSTAGSGWCSRTICSSRTSRPRERGLRPAARGAQPRAARHRAHGVLDRLGLARPAPTPARASGPAGRPSASPWPGPWSPTPTCCCSTSRWPRSTPAPATDVRPTCAATSTASRPHRAGHPRPARRHRARRPHRRARDRVGVQHGTPTEVARAPRTPYVAELVGLNLHRGTSRGTTVDLTEGGTLHTAQPTTGAVFLAYPPSAVALHRHRPEGSARNVWRGRITSLEHHGSTVRVRLDGEPGVLADVTTAAAAGAWSWAARWTCLVPPLGARGRRTAIRPVRWTRQNRRSTKAYRACVWSPAPSVRPEVPRGVGSSQGVLLRGRRSARRPAAAPRPSPSSRTYWRASMRARALATPASFTA